MLFYIFIWLSTEKQFKYLIKMLWTAKNTLKFIGSEKKSWCWRFMIMIHGNVTCKWSFSKRRAATEVCVEPEYEKRMEEKYRAVCYIGKLHSFFSMERVLAENQHYTCWRLGDFIFLPVFKPQSFLAFYFYHFICETKY